MFVYSVAVIPNEEKEPKDREKSTSKMKSDLEYVTLMKISENQYEDPRKSMLRSIRLVFAAASLDN